MQSIRTNDTNMYSRGYTGKCAGRRIEGHDAIQSFTVSSDFWAQPLQTRTALYQIARRNHHTCKTSAVIFRASWTSYGSKWTQDVQLPMPTGNTASTEISDAHNKSVIDSTSLLIDYRKMIRSLRTANVQLTQLLLETLNPCKFTFPKSNTVAVNRNDYSIQSPEIG